MQELSISESLIITGPKGRLSAIVHRPRLKDGETCPMVVLMHGFMANKRMEPLRSIVQALDENGIASLRFDFDGHGRSDGFFSDMTVLTEIDDARAVYAYVAGLDYVDKVAFVGHSQGGVVAGMVAGELGADKVSCLVQLAAAAVLKDDALHGVLMGRRYDPNHLPDHLRVFFHKVGRNYFAVAQTLPIFETSASYEGPVCLIHGKEDAIVPYSYSEQYKACYKNGELHLLDKENHFLKKRRRDVVAIATEFLKRNLL